MISTSEYTALEIANATGGNLSGENVSVYDITTDSKEKSARGSCFFAIKGKNYDGNEYLPEAINNGAKIIVTNQEIPYPVSVIRVKDSVKALGMLGKYHKGNTKIIGITGSCGKTTTKDMIKSVLNKQYSVAATYENNNNEIGVAKTLLSIKGEKYCVVEMGMRGIGEIEWLSYISEPEISVITNSLSSHIELLGSRENIFKAKCEILNHTKKIAILACEERFKKLKFNKIHPFFVGEEGDFAFSDIKYVENGINFNFSNKNINSKMHINSFGIHDVKNAAFACAVGTICGVDIDKIRRGLSEFHHSSMRNNIFKIGDITVMEDCYNASYEGMKSAIVSLCNYCKSNGFIPYAVLGDMLEIGDMSREYHYKIGKFAKDTGIKNIFTCGNFSNDYISGFGNGIECNDIYDIYMKIKNTLPFNSALLIKASRGMHFEKISELLRGK